VVGGVDELARRINATAPKVDAVLKGIKARAPNARILVVPYIAIMPAGSPILCWPQLPIAYDDVTYLRGTQIKLNQMLATASAANGATYVDVYTPSVPHDACELPGIRWNEPAIPVNLAAPLHPNVLGMLGVAQVVEAALRT
jgi:hypothetical protein